MDSPHTTARSAPASSRARRHALAASPIVMTFPTPSAPPNPGRFGARTMSGSVSDSTWGSHIEASSGNAWISSRASVMAISLLSYHGPAGRSGDHGAPRHGHLQGPGHDLEHRRQRNRTFPVGVHVEPPVGGDLHSRPPEHRDLGMAHVSPPEHLREGPQELALRHPAHHARLELAV